MALPRQLTQLAFAAGLDESTEAEVLDPSSGFPVLQNVRQDRRGGVSKRLGFGTVTSSRTSGSARTDGYRCFAHRGSPCVISSTGVDVYSDGLAANVPASGSLSRCTVEIIPLVASAPTISPFNYDAVACNGFLILGAGSYEANTRVNVSVHRADTPTALVRAETLSTAYASHTIHLATVGNTAFLAICAVSGGGLGIIDIYKLDCTSVTTIASGWTLVLSINDHYTGSTLAFSVCSLSTAIAVAYANNSAGTSKLTVKTVNASGLVASTTVNTSSTLPNQVGIASDGATGLWACWDESTNVRLAALNPSTLAALTATLTIGTSGLMTTRPPIILPTSTTTAIVYLSPAPVGRLDPPRIGLPPVKLSPAFRPPPPNGKWSQPTKGMPSSSGGVRRMAPPALPPPNYPPQELPDKDAAPFVWDNSNSQYGLMGVAAGADVGIEVPDQYFQEVERHWLTYQLRTGEWCYRLDRPAGYLAMTCAGVASLMTTHDYLQAPYVAKVGHQPGPTDEALGAAFDWLGRADNAVTVDGPQKIYVGYTLFGLERVGLASGYKYLGTHDWYPELARKVVLSQSPNGTWGKSEQPTSDTLIDTAYSILFLARGRHPVMMNKLQLDPAGKSDHGEWNNRPRDLANLARFTSRELERPVQWQVVPLDRDPADWSDAPILYLASHAAIKLSDAEVARIRAFIDAGGMFFTQADDGASAFNTYVDRLAERLYPDRPLKDLRPDHELYTLQYQIPAGKRPRLRGMIDPAGRLVWVHSPSDLAVSWQQRAETTKRTDFELGVNLFAYAVGKSDLRNRLQPRAISSPALASPSATLNVTRVKYPGMWNPSPLAFDRLGRWFAGETSLGLKVIESDAAQVGPTGRGRDVAHLVLAVGSSLAEADATALRQFVTDGGTLIVESPGATSPAAVGPRTAIRGELLGSGLGKVFPTENFEPVTQDHPLVNPTFPGVEKIWPLKVRPYAIKAMGDEIPPIRIARVGKGVIVHLPLDVSSGLLGCAEWGIPGYEPATAQFLMKNLLLWSSDRP